MLNAENQKFGRGRRKCIFCGGYGNITKEHVFGLWLKKYFPRDKNTTHKSANISWRNETGPHEPTDRREPNRQGHVGSKKLRIICRQCNNQWLSGLEDRVSRALPPLIYGNRANLLVGGQALLATWAAKTAMVAEFFEPVVSGISQEERTWLKEKLLPPDKWFVWISAYQGTDWGNLGIYQSRVGLSLIPIAKPSDAPFYAQATTFAVGRILFCVVSGSSPDMERCFAGKESDGFIQIWPAQYRSILWPPLTVYEDSEANGIANILSMSNVFNQSLDPGANWMFRGHNIE